MISVKSMAALKMGDMENDGFGKRQLGIKLTLTTEQQGIKMTDLKNNGPNCSRDVFSRCSRFQQWHWVVSAIVVGRGSASCHLPPWRIPCTRDDVLLNLLWRQHPAEYSRNPSLNGEPFYCGVANADGSAKMSVSVSMSKTFIGCAVCRRVRIGGAGGRRNIRSCRMQQRTVQFWGMPWNRWW